MTSDKAEKPVALIGGITGGIGSHLAARLHKEGWTVEGFARGERKNETLADQGINVSEADTRDPEAIEKVVTQTLEKHGRIDGYAHCIGSIVIQPLSQVSLEAFEETLRLNLTSAFFALKTLAPIMTKARRGSMVFVSTVAAVRGIPNHEAISAAKAGLDGMMRSAAASLANRSVRLNTVAPALVETPLSSPFISSEQAREAVQRMNPMGAILDPDAVSSLIAWLLSDDARHVSGQTYGVDGGLAALTQRPKM